MIEVSHLTKYFDTFRAVDDLSFSAKRGDVLGFLGPNGAGKSTTMKMITGFIAPSKGRVTILGHDIQKQPLQAKQKIGYLPEGAPSYDDMTPLQFLKFIARMRQISARQQTASIDKVVHQVALQGVLNQPIATLSKGFKRRLGLAQAIIHDPDILILDEPTDGLDPNQKQQVRDLIMQMAADKLIIVSTHILEEVSAVCNRAMIIARGKKLVDETPEQLAMRSKYHNAVELRFAQPAPQIVQLEQLPQVSAVEMADTGHAVTVFPHQGLNIFTEVNQWLQQQSLNAEQIMVEKGRLDDVFQQLTAEVA